MNFIPDTEYELMEYCIKKKGKWWANHFIRNKEVDNLYTELRQKTLTEILMIVRCGDD